MYWPAPLVAALGAPVTAMNWAIRCMRRVLPRLESPHLSALLQDLQCLDGWLSDPPHETIVRDKGEEIWCRRPGRDDSQTAVAQLVFDFSKSLKSDFQFGGRFTSAGMSVMCGLKNPQPDRVEICIHEFEEIAELPRP